MTKSPYEPRGFQHRGGYQPKTRSDKLPSPPDGKTGENVEEDKLHLKRMQLELEAQELCNAERKISIEAQALNAQRILFGLKMERTEHARRNIECLSKSNSLNLDAIDGGKKLFNDAVIDNLKVLKEFASEPLPKPSSP